MADERFKNLAHSLASFLPGLAASIDVVEERLRVHGLQDDRDLRRTLTAMRSGASDLERLTEALAAMGASGEAQCDIREVVNAVLAVHEERLLRNNIGLRAVLPESDVSTLVRVPFAVCFMALDNLIRNSTEAIVASGKIEVIVERENRRVACRVQDDGPGLAGIKPEGGAVAGKMKGGTGLRSSRESLEEYAAQLEVSNPGPGGTVFTVLLPC